MEDKKAEVIAYLDSYWWMRKELSRLEDKITELETRCYKVTQHLSGVAVKQRGGRSRSAWDALVDARSKAVDAAKGALDRCHDIESFIATVEPVKLRQLLRYRYISCLTFDRVAEEMNYSERQVRRLHKAALDAACIAWDAWTDRDGVR